MDDNSYTSAGLVGSGVTEGVEVHRVGYLNRLPKYESHPDGRPDHDTYFMAIARAVSERGTCPRRKVGAVLTINNHIVSTGYNGAPAGQPQCNTDGCDMEHGHCVRTIHSELNALLQAASAGRMTFGATLYTTASPCRNCMGAIINAGVQRVVYADPYKDPTHQGDKSLWAFEAAQRRGIEMVNLVKAPK